LSQSSFFPIQREFFMLNGPLHEQPRKQRATVIRTSNEFILLEWLKSTGRLIPREPVESEHRNEVEEISEIIDLDDIPYDNDDDDSEVELED
jgi:hypothetical protein